MELQSLQWLQHSWLPPQRQFRWFNLRYLVISTFIHFNSNAPNLHETNTILGGMEMRNPLRIWMMIPFAAIFTFYVFYYELIKNQTPPIFQFSPSVNSAIQAWGNQSGVHIAGQLLIFQFLWIGFLVVYLEWTNHD